MKAISSIPQRITLRGTGSIADKGTQVTQHARCLAVVTLAKYLTEESFNSLPEFNILRAIPAAGFTSAHLYIQQSIIHWKETSEIMQHHREFSASRLRPALEKPDKKAASQPSPPPTAKRLTQLEAAPTRAVAGSPACAIFGPGWTRVRLYGMNPYVSRGGTGRRHMQGGTVFSRSLCGL